MKEELKMERNCDTKECDRIGAINSAERMRFQNSGVGWGGGGGGAKRAKWEKRREDACITFRPRLCAEERTYSAPADSVS